jgi:HlyD family secretion protein
MSGIAFEQLDTLVRVTTVQAWVSLATLFALCAGAVLFAVLYWVPKKVNGEGILLIKKDRLSQVRSLGTGRLLRLEVGLGDPVKVGQQIGEISQADLQDAVRQSSARLDQLRDEDRRLTDFEKGERAKQEAAVTQLREAIRRTVANAHEGLKLADRIVSGSERLRLISQLSNLDYLKDLQQKHTIQNELNGGLSKLAELELTWLTANNQRQRVQLQRQLEIDRLALRLRLDQDKLDRTSRIVSHAEGTVTQVLTATDEFVSEGAPVVLLSSPRQAVLGTDDPARAYDSVVFVPAGEGKKIDVGDFVEVMPATVKREEYGYIHGEVVAVSELPATRRAMDAALQHPDLVDAFLKKYAPGVLLRVHVKLVERERTPGEDAGRRTDDPLNPFVWSTSSGPKQLLKTGTICEAAVVVEQQRLISLVLPWLRKLLDSR